MQDQKTRGKITFVEVVQSWAILGNYDVTTFIRGGVAQNCHPQWFTIVHASRQNCCLAVYKEVVA
eukprot:4892757-Amphidinium_carterae.1